MAPGQLILKLPMAIKPFRTHTDDPTVDQGAENRSELDTLEMPESEEGEGKQNAQKAADTIVSRFECMNVDAKPTRGLLDKQLVGLGGDVSAEKEGNTDRAEQHTDEIKNNAHRDAVGGDEGDEEDTAVQCKAVKHGGYKGKQVGKLEPPHENDREQKQDRLQGIFRHAEGEEGKGLRELEVQNIGRCDNHGNTEIRRLHQGRTKGQCKQGQNIGQLIGAYSFCFVHDATPQ